MINYLRLQYNYLQALVVGTAGEVLQTGAEMEVGSGFSGRVRA